jgi:hypothetical protein
MENGIVRDMTAEETTQFQKQQAINTTLENSRPLTETEVSRMLITSQINTLEVENNTALRMKEFYPQWKSLFNYNIGYKVQYNNKLWEVVQAHTSQLGWEPEAASALWKQIDEIHTGELTDPIPYNGNMALENGKYYIQDNEIYLCNRNTEIPVYSKLSELENLYVVKM